ncbi:hypothetical protein [Geosporobacter ferrireducens]|uniref:Uncharacterized protein n=1 Tax=Geosporobacter ferrireducens TaxID=1424294 RepID=A0A1D8GMT4_9FIRM|nr:hypothetical protein [Geosporobacter ferrireducens]AOT72214.1 hypothetical protein Gferi_23315 [Geosporobacter ferrireducens]MTI56108.1 hypothetical protein [Geosporobacter ferrireducens]
MRKIMLTVLSLGIILILGGCAKPTLKGLYQTEKDVNGYFVQISILQKDNSFVEYIDNREVDRGSYEKLDDNVYKMKSDKQNFKITLNNDNSFEIIINKLNDGNQIKMKNISATPTVFPAIFDDADEYKTLLE